jgi:hypothetical protein
MEREKLRNHSNSEPESQIEMHPEIELAKKNMTEELLKDTDNLNEAIAKFIETFEYDPKFDDMFQSDQEGNLTMELIYDIVSGLIRDPDVKKLMASIYQREKFLRSL